jgi:outer membrane protein assembly factor BamB
VTAVTKKNQARWADQVVWQRKFDESILAGPSLSGSTMFVGTAKGHLMALSSQNGKILWSTQLSSEVLSRPTIHQGHVFVRTVDGNLSDVDAKTGHVIWTVEHPMPSLSLRGIAPVTYADGKVYVGWEDGYVEALNATTGEQLWSTQVAIPKGRTDLERMVDIQSKVVINNNRVVVLGYHGKLVSLDITTGNLYWAKKLSGFRDFVVDDQAIYSVDEDGVLHAYDTENGMELWQNKQLKYRSLTDVENYSKQQLVLGDRYGVIHWIRKSDGAEVAHVRHTSKAGLGQEIVRVFVSGHHLLVEDTSGYVTDYKVVPSNWYEFNHPNDPMHIMPPKNMIKQIEKHS